MENAPTALLSLTHETFESENENVHVHDTWGLRLRATCAHGAGEGGGEEQVLKSRGGREGRMEMYR